MEGARNATASFEYWEPLVWEFSSAFSSLILFPFIAWFTIKYSWQWQSLLQSLAIYFLASLVFSFLHVGIMVSLRECVYMFTSHNYSFAHSFSELAYEMLYELRKDIWSFFVFVILITLYRQAIKQLVGDAHKVDERPPQKHTLSKHLLVKKLGKEFLIKTEQIEWVQASGNYVNLFIGDDIYPMRSTLTHFIDSEDCISFCRVHRSHAINLNFVKFILPLPSGDAEITMLSGATVRLSRRYKDNFEEMKLTHLA